MPHPLDLFRHCPHCGSGEFAINDDRSKRCARCGFVYYHNASAANVALIRNGRGELLVVRRGREPQKGWLDLPGGFCDLGETAEEGVRREVMEETGLQVREVRYLLSRPNTYVYGGFTVHTLDLFFACEVDEGTEPRAMDDAAEAMWMRPEELRIEDFAFESTRTGLREILKNTLIYKV